MSSIAFAASAIVTFVVQVAWIIPVVFVATLETARHIRSPARRHIVWIGAAALCFALPTLIAISAVPALAEAGAAPGPFGFSAHANGIVRTRLHFGVVSHTAPVALLVTFAAGYSLVCLWFGARLWYGLKANVVFRQNLRLVSLSSDALLLVRRIQAEYRIEALEIRCSPDVRTPMIVGVNRPVLILPAWLACDSGENLECVIRHELAHVVRRDALVNVVCRVLLLPVSPHPLAHRLLSRLEQAREEACDHCAARAMSPRAYAAALIRVASLIGGDATRQQFSSALKFVRHSVLEARIDALLGAAESNIRWRRRAIGAPALALTFAILVWASPRIVITAPLRGVPAASLEQRVLGTWSARADRGKLLTLSLRPGTRGLSGSLTRSGFRFDPLGRLIEAHALPGADPVRATPVAPNTLQVTTTGSITTSAFGRAQGAVYEFVLVTHDSAELRLRGAGARTVALPLARDHVSD